MLIQHDMSSFILYDRVQAETFGHIMEPSAACSVQRHIDDDDLVMRNMLGVLLLLRMLV